MIYMYGMLMCTNSYLINGELPKEDGYGEIKKHFFGIGGETGCASAILCNLGCELTIDGTHLGKVSYQPNFDYFKDKNVDMSLVTYDESIDGCVDLVLITGNKRTVFGSFGEFFSVRHYNSPSKEAISKANIVSIDPFFNEESNKAAQYCNELGKKFVTIDSHYETDMHKYCEVNVISHQSLGWWHTDMTKEEIYKLYTDTTDGLVILTYGEQGICYGRKGQEPKNFIPYSVDVVSTLGAGDSFKAGCTYALNAGMNDDEIVQFASATAGVAVSKYPIPENPPTLDEINALIKSR